ncbi:putative addiction module antidote protein, partial [Methylobacterium sp. WL2]
MPVETFTYDTAEHLQTPEDIALYIEAIMEDGDPALLAEAIGVVARARGMTQIAQETGRSREQLYRTLSEKGNPQLDTLMAVLRAIGVRLSVRPIEAVEVPRVASTPISPAPAIKYQSITVSKTGALDLLTIAAFHKSPTQVMREL